MYQLAFYLLLTWQVFANGFEDQEPLKQDSKFTFNFEQISQAPQVELRKENIEKYLYMQSITSTPEPFDSYSEDSLKELNETAMAQKPSVIPKTNTDSPIISALSPLPKRLKSNIYIPPTDLGIWIYESPYPKPMPPPRTIPKWEELREILKKQADQYFQSHAPSSDSYQHTLPTTTESPRESPEPSKEEHIPSQDVPVTSLPQTSLSKLGSFMPISPSTEVAIGAVPQRDHVLITRGNHKFSWDDVKKVATIPVTSTTSVNLAKLKRYPPPPVPTLSPWYDGFGK